MILDQEVIDRWIAIGRHKGFRGIVIFRHPVTGMLTVDGIEPSKGTDQLQFLPDSSVSQISTPIK